MPIIVMTVRTKDGVLVCDLGTAMAMLTHHGANYIGADWLIRPAYFSRRIGFHVPHINGRGSTLKIKKDARFCFGSLPGSSSGFHLEKLGKCKPSKKS